MKRFGTFLYLICSGHHVQLQVNPTCKLKTHQRLLAKYLGVWPVGRLKSHISGNQSIKTDMGSQEARSLDRVFSQLQTLKILAERENQSKSDFKPKYE